MNRIAILTILTSLTLLLSSCKLDSEPAEIEMVLPESLTEAQPRSSFSMPNEWWTSFDDDNLNILVDAALQDNLTLARCGSGWNRHATPLR